MISKGDIGGMAPDIAFFDGKYFFGFQKRIVKQGENMRTTTWRTVAQIFTLACSPFFLSMAGESVPRGIPGNTRSSPAGVGALGSVAALAGDLPSDVAQARATMAAFSDLLSRDPSLSVRELQGRVFLDGTITNAQTKQRVERLLKAYPMVVDLTNYEPDYDALEADIDLIRSRIENALNRNYVEETAFANRQRIGVDVVNGKIALTGVLNTPEDIARAESITRLFNSEVHSELAVHKQMIEISAVFARVSDIGGSYIGTQGLQNAVVTLPSISIDPTGRNYASLERMFSEYRWNSTYANFQTGANNLLNISARRDNRQSNILARPHLATMNGKAAEFHAGGTRIYEITTSDKSDIQEKDYGVILKTTPTLTSDGRIHLKVALEFSIPNGANDFTTFKHDGEAVVGKNQALVLSGLLKEIRTHANERTPGLSKIPVIGFFFGRNLKDSDNEDLVLAIHPRLPTLLENAPIPEIRQTADIMNRARRPMSPKDDCQEHGSVDAWGVSMPLDGDGLSESMNARGSAPESSGFVVPIIAPDQNRSVQTPEATEDTSEPESLSPPQAPDPEPSASPPAPPPPVSENKNSSIHDPSEPRTRLEYTGIWRGLYGNAGAHRTRAISAESHKPGAVPSFAALAITPAHFDAKDSTATRPDDSPRLTPVSDRLAVLSTGIYGIANPSPAAR